ncbi:unnamed protein product [Phytophthora fragariaefolia]|uniref:Unnamed protein product n=1 Tax=Phytophthora fragariaefolia TaxID=1490495 RepID=A0A9W6TWF4_9STRA|nr:unnamed protein product [Phytophthora fragariaefolia]
MKFKRGEMIEESPAFIPWLQYVKKLREGETDATKRQMIDEEVFELLRLSPTSIDDVLRSVARVQEMENLAESLKAHKARIIKSTREKLNSFY